MTYQVPPDIEKIVEGYLINGKYASADEVLRDALAALGQFAHGADELDQEYRETVEAVREGLADLKAGRTRTLHSLLEELDKNHGSSSP